MAYRKIMRHGQLVLPDEVREKLNKYARERYHKRKLAGLPVGNYQKKNPVVFDPVKYEQAKKESAANRKRLRRIEKKKLKFTNGLVDLAKELQ